LASKDLAKGGEQYYGVNLAIQRKGGQRWKEMEPTGKKRLGKQNARVQDFKRSGKREQSRRVWFWLATISATICCVGSQDQKILNK
jgi:hypothetical protein